MKNLFSLIFLTAIISCSYKNYDATVKLKIDNRKSVIGEHIGVEIAVDDSRIKDNLGVKKINKTKTIFIGLKNDIEQEIHKKVENYLLNRGFEKGKDRIIGIHITKLYYEAKKGYFVGESKVEVEIQVAIKNNNSKKITFKKYGETLSRNHFLLPSEKMDEKLINRALSDVIQDLLEDDDFLQSLIR